MHHFDRISHDPDKLFGIACIRDLPVLVSEVARPLIGGEKSLQDILDAFPGLQGEDVVQTLAYAAWELMASLLTLRKDYISVLNIITGASGVLAEGGFHEAGETSRAMMKLLHDNVLRIQNVFVEMWDWAYLTYGDYRPQHYYEDLRRLLEAARTIAASRVPERRIELHFPDSVPDVLCHRTYLELVVSYLLSVRFRDQTDSVTVESQQNASRVHLRFVHHGSFRPDSRQLMNNGFWTSDPLAVAATIIRLHGGELKADVTGNQITFEFELAARQDQLT